VLILICIAAARIMCSYSVFLHTEVNSYRNLLFDEISDFITVSPCLYYFIDLISIVRTYSEHYITSLDMIM